MGIISEYCPHCGVKNFPQEYYSSPNEIKLIYECKFCGSRYEHKKEKNNNGKEITLKTTTYKI